MARTKRQRARRRRILHDALGRLAPAYTLIQFGLNDELSDDQIVRILTGDSEAVEDEVAEWAVEARSLAAAEVIAELVDLDDRAVLAGGDEYEELRFAIEERDDAAPFRGLIHNTGPRLWRYDLGCVLDPGSGTWDENEIGATIAEMAAAAGIDLDANQAALRTLVRNAPYGGGLYVIWSGDTEELLTAVLATARDATSAPTAIAWTDPTLLVLDSLNGSGMDQQVRGTVRAAFHPNRLRLDTARGGGGYSWSDVVGSSPSVADTTASLTT